MLICNKCKKEMKCVRTGVTVRFTSSWVYSADLFECQSCGNQIIKCASEGYENKNVRSDDFIIPEV